MEDSLSRIFTMPSWLQTICGHSTVDVSIAWKVWWQFYYRCMKIPNDPCWTHLLIIYTQCTYNKHMHNCTNAYVHMHTLCSFVKLMWSGSSSRKVAIPSSSVTSWLRKAPMYGTAGVEHLGGEGDTVGGMNKGKSCEKKKPEDIVTDLQMQFQ